MKCLGNNPMKEPHIIQIIQAADRVTGLDKEGNIYTIEHGPNNTHYWVKLPIKFLPEGEPIPTPTGPNSRLNHKGN